MNISLSEILVVFIVALLLFGPEQLPQMARQLGKLAGDFRKLSNSVRREWYNVVYPPAEEIKRDLASHSQSLRNLKAEILSPPIGSAGTASGASIAKNNESKESDSSSTPLNEPSDPSSEKQI